MKGAFCNRRYSVACVPCKVMHAFAAELCSGSLCRALAFDRHSEREFKLGKDMTSAFFVAWLAVLKLHLAFQLPVIATARQIVSFSYNFSNALSLVGRGTSQARLLQLLQLARTRMRTVKPGY